MGDEGWVPRVFGWVLFVSGSVASAGGPCGLHQLSFFHCTPCLFTCVIVCSLMFLSHLRSPWASPASGWAAKQHHDDLRVVTDSKELRTGGSGCIVWCCFPKPLKWSEALFAAALWALDVD